MAKVASITARIIAYLITDDIGNRVGIKNLWKKKNWKYVGEGLECIYMHEKCEIVAWQKEDLEFISSVPA